MNFMLGLLALVALPACISALPPCMCGRIYSPVCGTDGVTYDNVCGLECEKHKGKENLGVARDGPCDAEAALRMCNCNMDDKPVCGNDGNTYRNRCVLTCMRLINSSIAVAHEGQC